MRNLPFLPVSFFVFAASDKRPPSDSGLAGDKERIKVASGAAARLKQEVMRQLQRTSGRRRFIGIRKGNWAVVLAGAKGVHRRAAGALAIVQNQAIMGFC